MAEKDTPLLPVELYVLFENGLFCGAFAEKSTAERTRDARWHGSADKKLQIAEYKLRGIDE